MKAKLFHWLYVSVGLCMAVLPAMAQTDTLLAPLITDIPYRHTITLNGSWHYIVDPYQTGYIDYRYRQTTRGYFLNQHVEHPDQLVEYNFETSPALLVPGDWNTQDAKLFYYEGTVWYERDFVYHPQSGRRVFLYFGAANYHAVVALNGKIIGEHVGGFTPFNMEVTGQLRNGNNFIVVMVDNTRHKEGVPTNNFDWWNYGGLTRDVCLIETPETFIQDYFIHLDDLRSRQIRGWVQLNGPQAAQTSVQLQIPEWRFSRSFTTDAQGRAYFSFQAPANMELWSPEHPRLYKLVWTAGSDTLGDEVGFRTIEVKGNDILLNGKSVFLRGVSIHEEAPFGGGRAYNAAQDHILLQWAKELGCNYVRLAHYPHNEAMIREAEKMGLLVWSEIPVYWTIDWTNPGTLANAKQQLAEEITRDKNRANIIIWSVGNETPRTAERLEFMKALVEQARSLDSTRLISAALQISRVRNDTSWLDDPLGQYLDVLGCNIYPGWYGPSADAGARFASIYQKPLIMSEFGAGALQGYHGDSTQRWTEEFQYRVLDEDIRLLKTIPFLRGTTPWILKDFRSPKRLLPFYQDGWNRKGLVSDRGVKKEAFYLMQQFYADIASGKISFGGERFGP
ncbi:MAG: beta-glucuronidase [Thermoflavifilum aggregans]|nr:beta-glucuronidase [Thermoflavifilum aggregans]